VINTRDREAIRRDRDVTVIRKTRDNTWTWSCPHCLFRNTWTTESGAVNSVAQHLQRHGKRLVLPSRNEQGHDHGQV